jgi:hypothetical protein
VGFDIFLAQLPLFANPLGLLHLQSDEIFSHVPFTKDDFDDHQDSTTLRVPTLSYAPFPVPPE